MNPDDLKQVLAALSQADVREFSLETGEYKLSIKRGPETGPPAPIAFSTVPSAAPSAPAPTPEAPSSPAASGASASVPTVSGAPTSSAGAGTLSAVKAPIVGTFYAASAPDKPPFVQVGDRVQKGQTLCILEAMKLMNEIESELAGVLREIKVKNGEPVEYGQELFLIEPV